MCANRLMYLATVACVWILSDVKTSISDDIGEKPRVSRSLGSMWQYHTLLGLSPDGKKLLLGGRSGILAIYDLTAGKVVNEVHTQESVQDARYSPDGKWLAIAEWRDGFTLRDARTLRVVKQVSGSGGLGAWQVRFTPDSSRLVCYSWWQSDRQFWSYDLKTDKEIGWASYTIRDTSTSLVRERLAKSGNHLLSIDKQSKKGTPTGFQMWVTDSVTGKPSAKLKLGEKDFHQFALSPNGKHAIVKQPGEDPRVIDTTNGKTVANLEGHNSWVTCAAYSPDGRFIATASGTTVNSFGLVLTEKRPARLAATEIMLRDALTGKQVSILEDDGKRRDYQFIGFSPNGTFVYAITRENELMLWGDMPEIPDGFEPLPNYDGEIQEKRLASERRSGSERTLKFFLAKSTLVVSGTIASRPEYVEEAPGVANYKCVFEVEDVLKGSPALKSKKIEVNIARLEDGMQDRHPLIRQQSSCILFLKAMPKGKMPYWKTCDFWFGLQHPSPRMVEAIKKIEK